MLTVTNASLNQQPRSVSIWVKLFVLFHIIAITSFAMPTPPAAIREQRVQPGGSEWLVYWNDTYVKTLPPISIYLKETGFWQYWDMFAPNPSHTDTWCDAVIKYKDGTTKRYAYPRMYDLPLWKKFLQERYRKFFERAGSDDYYFLCPSFGLRMALLNDNLNNPPVQVQIFRHFKQVAEPGKFQDPNYKSYCYYTYIVDQVDLARVRRLAQ